MLTRPLARCRQRGIALVVGLVMLTVLTLLVVTAIKIGILELKIGGVSYGAAQNFANIELALSRFMKDNGVAFHAGCLIADRNDTTLSCFYPTPTKPADVTVTGSGGTRFTASYALYAGTVDIQAQEVSCVSDSGRGSGNYVADGVRAPPPDRFTADLTARAQGSISGLTIVRQGGARVLAGGAC